MGAVSRIKKKTGPRVGQPHSGQFKSIDSRRYIPDGAKGKVRKAVEELCKQHAEDAVAYLANLLQDPDANPKERLVAAGELLDRGYGKAVDRVAIQQVGQAQGSLKNADMDVLMGVLESRIAIDVCSDSAEPLALLGESHELNGSFNRQDADDD